MLCDCGDFAFENRVTIKGIERIELSEAAERQQTHKRFNRALIPICTERLRAEEAPNLWKIVFLAMNRSTDMTFFEPILLFLVESAQPNELIDSFLSDVQAKRLALPASVLSKLQSQPLSLHSRTVVLQFIYDGKQSDRPTSPTLRSTRFWKEEALDLFVGGIPCELKSVSIELRNKIDPLLQLVMTNQRASHCFHQIIAVLRASDAPTQRSLVDYMLESHESFPFRVVQLLNGSCVRREDAVEMMRLLLQFHAYKTCSVLQQHDCLLSRDCFRLLQSQTCTRFSLTSIVARWRSPIEARRAWSHVCHDILKCRSAHSSMMRQLSQWIASLQDRLRYPLDSAVIGDLQSVTDYLCELLKEEIGLLKDCEAALKLIGPLLQCVASLACVDELYPIVLRSHVFVHCMLLCRRSLDAELRSTLLRFLLACSSHPEWFAASVQQGLLAMIVALKARVKERREVSLFLFVCSVLVRYSGLGKAM